MAIQKRFWAYLACQFGGWMGQAGLNYFFTSMYTPLGTIKQAYAGLFLCGAMTAILVTHLYRDWVHHHNWTRLRFRELIPRVLLASVILGSLITALVTAEWSAALVGVRWLPGEASSRRRNRNVPPPGTVVSGDKKNLKDTVRFCR